MRRGELWWAVLPIGTHPVVTISRDDSYQRRRRATVALVTTTRRGIPVEVPVGEENGLDHASVVNTDDLWTIRLSDLIEQLGELDVQQTTAMDNALRFALGLA